MEEEKLPDIEQPLSDEIPQFRGIIVILAERLRKLRNVLHNDKFIRSLKIISIILSAAISALAILAFVIYFVPFLKESIPVHETVVTADHELMKDPLYRKEISNTNRDLQRLNRKYTNYTSGQSYVVINTTENRFFLYRNKQLVREGFCSSGSYTMLKTAEGDKKWIFKTPKGKYRIQGKTTHPVWRRPDWAFVEEGLPIPSSNDPSRYEYGVLGDYAMAIGDGYLIHGTIYKRFLGMPVTHGCVRLNDEDLEVIFNTLSVGSKVYIF